jgi:multisubunit Na+/H+ antiporter MnhB subunit
MVVPFICAFVLWIASFTAALVSVVVAILYVLSYYSLIKEVRQQPSLSVALMFPFAVIVDLFLLHLSMFRYEFGSVEWKGRNICIPVMHVTTGRNTKTLIK